MSQTTTAFNSAAASWEEHRAAFFNALDKSDKATINTVLTKYPEAVDWQDPKGKTPLHTAFEKRDNDLFVFLLDKGASPNQEAPLTGLEAIFSAYDSACILDKAVKGGAKDYIIPLLQRGARQDNLRYSPPKAVRFEIEDLMKRSSKIRAEFLVTQKQQAFTPATIATAQQPDTDANAADTDLEVLKPIQLKNRTPAATS